MHVTIVGQHVPHVPRMQGLLGPDYEVTGAATLPADGPIETDVLVSSRLSAQEAPRLRARLLQTPGAGLNDVALDAVPPGVRVCNVFEHEIPIAEYVMHAVLDHAMFPDPPVPPLDAEHWPAAYFNRPLHGEVRGLRMGIVGFGNIGSTVARQARALGMTVTAITRRGQPLEGADHSVKVADLRGALPQLDVLVLCCPLSDETRGLIGAEELAALPSTAMLINVARAEVVQEQAVFEAMQQRVISRAVLDVWYRYPAVGQQVLAPSAFPFHTLANVRCTPHISGWTQGLIERRYAVMADNIRRLRAGETLLNPVR